MQSSGIRHETCFWASRPRISRIGFLLVAAGLGHAAAAPPNWTGEFAPCQRTPDLLSLDPVDLGVRISTSNNLLARQFLRAMDFWTGVVDLQWHPVDSRECSIQLVDGTPDLFDASGIAARSQFPDRPGFEGWIAFNPGSRLTADEMFRISVHEIGHLLGLPHNPSGSSVMFFLDLDRSPSLDSADLDALASRHRLRASFASIRDVPGTRVAVR